MKHIFIAVLISSVLLASCSVQQTQPPVVITDSPIPTITYSATATIEPTRTPPPSVTPTPTYPPYEVKEVLMEYRYSGGDHGILDDLVSPHLPRLVLYSDGLLIITKDDTLYQKVLSEAEIHSFLSQIEQRGFYNIETNQQHYPTDKLYNFSSGYESAFDGRYLCVSAQTKRICAYEPVMDYVIPSMKGIFQYLDGYFPNNMAPYEADRLLLHIIKGSDYLPEEIRPEPMQWSTDLPALQETVALFVDGENAIKISELFNHSVSWRIIIDKDTEYTVFARPVLPHEVLGHP